MRSPPGSGRGNTAHRTYVSGTASGPIGKPAGQRFASTAPHPAADQPQHDVGHGLAWPGLHFETGYRNKQTGAPAGRPE